MAVAPGCGNTVNTAAQRNGEEIPLESSYGKSATLEELSAWPSCGVKTILDELSLMGKKENLNQRFAKAAHPLHAAPSPHPQTGTQH